MIILKFSTVMRKLCILRGLVNFHMLMTKLLRQKIPKKSVLIGCSMSSEKHPPLFNGKTSKPHCFNGVDLKSKKFIMIQIKQHECLQLYLMNGFILSMKL